MSRFRNFIDWLLGRPKPSAERPSIFPQSLLEDADFQTILQTEINAIKPNLPQVKFLLKSDYTALGGNFDSFKILIVSLFMSRVQKRLDKVELPIYFKPFRSQIEDFVKDIIGKGFDDFFTDN